MRLLTVAVVLLGVILVLVGIGTARYTRYDPVAADIMNELRNRISLGDPWRTLLLEPTPRAASDRALLDWNMLVLATFNAWGSQLTGGANKGCDLLSRTVAYAKQRQLSAGTESSCPWTAPLNLPTRATLDLLQRAQTLDIATHR